MISVDVTALLLATTSTNFWKAVDELLRGNDMQCFTTKQFSEVYDRLCNAHTNSDSRGDWARTLLRIRCFEEVKPDLWRQP